MKVKWTPYASGQRKEVAAYVRKKFGSKRAKKFRDEVDQMAALLSRSPNIGRIDPLYEDRPETYRSVIVNGLNKMVYRVAADTIYIVDFWDTRQEPQARANQTE